MREGEWPPAEESRAESESLAISVIYNKPRALRGKRVTAATAATAAAHIKTISSVVQPAEDIKKEEEEKAPPLLRHCAAMSLLHLGGKLQSQSDAPE